MVQGLEARGSTRFGYGTGRDRQAQGLKTGGEVRAGNNTEKANKTDRGNPKFGTSSGGGPDPVKQSEMAEAQARERQNSEIHEQTGNRSR